MIVTANRADIEYMKKVWWSRPISIFYVVLFAVFTFGICLEMLLSVLDYIKTGEGLGFVLASFAIFAFSAYNLFKWSITPQRLLKKINKISHDVVETVTFSENGFSADNKGTGLNEHVEYGYERVTKAFYSDNWFVICCDKNRIYPIHVRSFVQGTPDQLGALLAAKLGAKYKRK